ncbi:conjugal transfer protein [Marinithermofilum abyssi]|uniref:Conjugal transfer protein n=1 Tax=Marinithermofilum abyssi TaxID=1571185 RepID=A0A8J2YEK3_9BACL|nr:ATP-binding protein [Marinithermofilum abyssi]GGE28652.1 conjugal transfer protein [Marinithermofilum abyssi]
MAKKRKQKKLKNPYKFYSGNLIVSRFKRNRACAVYRLSAEDYDLFSTENGDHEEKLSHLQGILEYLEYPGQLKQIPVPVIPEASTFLDKEKVPTGLKVFSEHRVKNMIQYVQDCSYDHKKYLVIGLTQEPIDPIKDFISYVTEGILNPIRTLNEIMADVPFQAAKSEWDRFRKAEQRVFHLLQTKFRLERVDEDELGWLIERSACRGYNPEKKRHKNELVDRYGRVMASPNEVLPGNTDTRLSVKAVRGMIRYQKELPDSLKEGFFSFVSVSRFPEAAYFPGATELFLFAQSFHRPVEVNVTFYPEGANFNKYQLERSSKKAKGQMKHDAKKNQEGWSPQKTRDQALELHERLDQEYKGKEKARPIFRIQVTLCVWGRSEEEVREAREDLMRELNRMKYEVQIPMNIQAQLFYNTLPGVLNPVGHSYNIKATSEWMAAMMPLAQLALGDPKGTLLGRVGTVPVLLDTERGPRDLSKSPSILILGPTGSGKSLLANVIIIGVVLRGGKVLITDIKDERWAWIFELPELADYINVITLSNESDAGRMDPLSLIKVNPEIKEKSIEIATRIIQFLCECSSNDYQGIVLSYAIRHAANSNNPCLQEVINFIERYLEDPEMDIPGVFRRDAEKEVRLLNAKLTHHSQHPKTRLIFGKGTEEPLDLSYPINILQVSGMTVPDPNHADYRQVMAMHMAQAELCRSFVASAEHCLTIYEEAWSNKLKESKKGELNEARAVIQELIKTGRSFNNGVVLISQDNDDLALEEGDEGRIANNIGIRFVFRQNHREEAAKSCAVLGIESSEENLELLTKEKRLPKKHFLMRDLEERVGRVYFPLDEIDPYLYQAFDTSKNAQDRRNEKFGHLRKLPFEEQRRIAKEMAGMAHDRKLEEVLV